MSTVPFGRYTDAQFGVPRAMVDLVENGYYAVREAEHSDWVFLRVSRPDSGQHKDHIKIQSQHGERLKLVCLVLPPESSVGYSVINGQVKDLIITLVVNPKMAAVQYGREVGQCCRCGKPLTDNRSRHYGIGPECEKYWPDIIELVDEDEELAKLREDDEEEHEPYF
ncbi:MULTISPECIES: DUF6011 domain-containing protein [Streptomyces]|uniref:DUF6011 domain-containing protein n=1 Tax=Streptomyces TaxID=1883 RepID=UPI00365116F4